MVNLLSQGGQVDYGTKEYILDTPEDVANLIIIGQNCDAGSTAFIIETSEIYMKNGQGGVGFNMSLDITTYALARKYTDKKNRRSRQWSYN